MSGEISGALQQATSGSKKKRMLQARNAIMQDPFIFMAKEI